MDLKENQFKSSFKLRQIEYVTCSTKTLHSVFTSFEKSACHHRRGLSRDVSHRNKTALKKVNSELKKKT